jgi:hypothetical protein
MCLGDLGSPFAPPFQRSDLPVTYRHFRRFLGWSGETAIPVVCLGQCGNASAPLMFGLADDPTFGGLAIRSNVSSETFIPVMCLGHRGSPLAPSVRGQTKSERSFGERGSDRASSAANSPGRLQKRNKPDFPSLLQSWIHVPTMPPFQVVPHRMPPVGCRRRRPPPFLFREQTRRALSASPSLYRTRWSHPEIEARVCFAEQTAEGRRTRDGGSAAAGAPHVGLTRLGRGEAARA